MQAGFSHQAISQTPLNVNFSTSKKFECGFIIRNPAQTKNIFQLIFDISIFYDLIAFTEVTGDRFPNSTFLCVYRSQTDGK